MKIIVPIKSTHFSVNPGDLITTDSGYYMFFEGNTSGQFKYDLVDLQTYKTVNRYPQLYSMCKLNIDGEMETILQVIPSEQLLLTLRFEGRMGND